MTPPLDLLLKLHTDGSSVENRGQPSFGFGCGGVGGKGYS